MTDNLPPLLPCPFCGNEKNIAMANEKHNHSGGYFIACPACDASTGLRYACGEDPRPLLVEQWNRRAAIAQAQSCVPAGMVLASVELLKRAESSLGSFCSDHGWGDADMQTMDDISGLLAASPQPQPVQPTTVHCYKHAPDEPVSGCKYCDGKSSQAKPEQAAQPLTYQEIWDNDKIMEANASAQIGMEHIVAFVRATEAAHGIAAPQPKD